MALWILVIFANCWARTAFLIVTSFGSSESVMLIPYFFYFVYPRRICNWSTRLSVCSFKVLFWVMRNYRCYAFFSYEFTGTGGWYASFYVFCWGFSLLDFYLFSYFFPLLLKFLFELKLWDGDMAEVCMIALLFYGFSFISLYISEDCILNFKGLLSICLLIVYWSFFISDCEKVRFSGWSIDRANE